MLRGPPRSIRHKFRFPLAAMPRPTISRRPDRAHRDCCGPRVCGGERRRFWHAAEYCPCPEQNGTTPRRDAKKMPHRLTIVMGIERYANNIRTDGMKLA